VTGPSIRGNFTGESEVTEKSNRELEGAGCRRRRRGGGRKGRFALKGTREPHGENRRVTGGGAEKEIEEITGGRARRKEREKKQGEEEEKILSACEEKNVRSKG